MSGTAQASEATLPERRRFFLLVGAVNLVFLAFDATAPAPHRGVVLAARVLLTVWLLGAPLVLARTPSARAARAFTRGLAVLVAVTFGALVWGSGGEAGRYGTFYALLPLVLAIMVPDDPWASAACGLTVWLTGVFTIATDPVFWSLGTLAMTLYAVAGAWFHRAGLRRREAQRREARQLEARLAELEQQRADLEKQRALDDRLALLGRLVTDVAHELRNPLAYVSMNVSLLREDLDHRGASEALTDAEQGISRIKGLIEDLRAFARDEPEPVGACELAPIVDEALRVAGVRLSAIASVERDVPADLPRITASTRRLVQVLVNVLVNAADALEARPAPRKVRLSVRPDAGGLALSIEDNGAGIPPELAPRLFTRFASTKGAKGTGLGLSLSRDHLAAFGATIEAGPSELGGARFTIHLPSAP